MKILVVDTETTGLNPESDHLIEIAAILWSVRHKSTLMQVSSIINYDQPVPNPAEPLNGISSSLLREHIPFRLVFSNINEMAAEVDYVCAHNASFDKKFCDKVPGLRLSSHKWIDTRDIIYPKSKYCKSRSLINLAVSHEIPVVDIHRALDDCKLLVKLLALVPDLEKELKEAAQPKVLIKSLEEKPGTLSKLNGFRWHSIVPHSWAKYVRKQDIDNFPFPVETVNLGEHYDTAVSISEGK